MMQSHQRRRLSVVPLAQTTVEDSFWRSRLDLFRRITINDVFDKFERDGAFANFDQVAQGQRGLHRGSPWFDGLIFETMRAASDFLATSDDPQLDARLDRYIQQIAAAQAIDPDGYLNTYVTLMRPETRWGALGSDQLWSHEEYNAGCLVEAGVHHYQATRKTNLLQLGVRFADYLCDLCGPAPKRNIVPSHSLPEEALLKLYRLLRDEPSLAQRLGARGSPERYLALVRFWIDNRGNHEGRTSFSEYAQDHLPVLAQDAAVGHAVRATLLYTGISALAQEIDAPDYLETSLRLWRDVTERKLYLTGGVGAINQYEGFSFGYYLPSDGYNETCAAVGLAFWAGQLNQATGSAVFADIIERVLYNAALAGVSLSGTQYSYENPLATQGQRHRWYWHRCPCCPPMLLKLYACLGEQIYAHSQHAIVINQYIGSTARIPLAAGEVTIELQSALPWHGQVAVTLHMPQPQSFGLHFRLPEWCPAVRVSMRGERCAFVVRDGYGVIEAEWQDGDTLELEFEMPIQRIMAHPFVNQLRGRVALRRGPLVYCVEGVDLLADTAPTLAAEPHLAFEERPDMLGGVVVISAQTPDGQTVQAIPYYSWDNRRAADAAHDWMAVWLMQDEAYELRCQREGDDRAGWEQQLYRPLQAESIG